MADYPNLWKRGLIQKRIRERANHLCEECGIEFIEGTNIAVSAVNDAGKPIIGGVHHIDSNKANCAYCNLVYLCQRCHLRVQYTWLPGGVLPKHWGATPPAWIVRRALPYIPYPHPIQITLLEVNS